MNIQLAEKTLGFKISVQDGIAWPHTGPANNPISAFTRGTRLAAMARHFDRKICGNLYIRIK